MKDGSGSAEKRGDAKGKQGGGFPRQKFLAMTLVLLLIAAGVFYYIQHIQRNREHLTRHNLRHLGTIATVIEDRIGAFGAAADNLQYIDTVLTAEIVREAFPFPTAVGITHTKKKKQGRASNEQAASMAAADSSWEYTIANSIVHIRRIFPDKGVSLTVTARIKDVLDVGGISEGAFDALLITGQSGSEVLYNSHQRQLPLTRIDTVVTDSGPVPFETAARNPNAGKTTFAGQTYEIYLHVMGRYRFCGLLSSDQYETKARTVHGTFFIDAILLLFLLLIAVPLITLHFADYGERIRPLNVLVNIGCIIVGSAIVVLLMADIVYGKYEANARDNATLLALADSIERRVHDEFDRVRNMQHHLSQWLDDEFELPQRNRIFPTRDTAETARLPFTRIDANRDVNHILRLYPFFEQLYWLDDEGKMVAHWTTGKEVFDGVPLGDREYFTEVRDGASEWVFPHYTRATGQFMVAFSRKTDDRFLRKGAQKGKQRRVASVAAVDFLPRSLVDVWLPAGYGYMIVDMSGDVLFHSTKHRALHENAFLECGDAAMPDLIAQRVAGFLSTRYWEDEVHMYLTPMSLTEKQQWYLVVFSEQDMLMDMKTGTLMTAGMLYLLFFIPLMIGFISYVLLWDRHLAMLWYKEGMGSWYRRTTILTLLISLVTLIAALTTRSLFFAIIAAIVLPHIAYIGVFVGLDQRTHEQPLKSGISVMLSLRRWSPFLLHLVLLSLLVWIIDRSAPESIESALQVDTPWWVLLLLLILLLVDLLFVAVKRNVRKWTAAGGVLQKFESSELQQIMGLREDAEPLHSARRWYRGVLTAVVILVGLVPTVIFYRVSSDLHSIAYYRTQQHDYARYSRERDENIARKFGTRVIDWTSPADMSSGMDTVRILAWAFDDDRYLFRNPDEARTRHYAWETGYTVNDTLLRAVMLPVNSNAARYRRYLSSHPGREDRRLLTALRSEGDRSMQVIPQRMFTLIPAFGGFLPLGISVAVFVSLLVLVIGYGTRRIFFSNITVVSRNGDTYAHENQLLLWTTDEEREEIRKALKSHGLGDLHQELNKQNIDSFAAPEKTDVREAERIVLENFEYCYNDAAFNLKKLALLEYLLFTLQCRVCIICSVDPVYYFFEDDGSPSSRRLRDRWTRVLNMFVRSATALHYRRPSWASVCSPLRGMEELSIFAQRECALPGMDDTRTVLRQKLAHGELRSRDEIVRWLSVHCRPLYQSLWMTCTRRERLILYRIARDGFAPYRARSEISNLLERGLLARNPALCFSSACFQEFVREAKTPEQIRSWESQEATGLWGNIKHPLIIGFVLIAAALFYANPAYFDSTVAILTAMAGAIPLLLRVRGFLTGIKSE